MSQICLNFLISTYMCLALAAASSRSIEPTIVNPPASSPLNNNNLRIAEAPKSRKLGKHHVSESKPPTIAPTSEHKENGENTISPLNNNNVRIAEAPKSQRLGKHHVSEELKPPTIAPSSEHEENGENTSEGHEMYLEKQHHHKHESDSVNKSMAGGGVILGGLVMAFVVSIVCYIRATRRRSLVEPPTPTTARSGSS